MDRGIDRLFLRHLAALLLLLPLSMASAPAGAFTWTVDPSSQVTLTVTIDNASTGTMGPEQGSTAFGGSQAGTATDLFGPTTQLSFSGGGLTQGPLDLAFYSDSLGLSIPVSFSGVGGRLSGGTSFAPAWTDLFGVDASFDGAGLSLTLDQGTIDAVVLSSVASFSLESNPIAFDLTGQGGSYSAREQQTYYCDGYDCYYYPTGLYELALAFSFAGAPASITLSSGLGPVDVTFELTGSLLLTAVVPEPGTMGLLATGLALLGWRRQAS